MMAAWSKGLELSPLNFILLPIKNLVLQHWIYESYIKKTKLILFVQAPKHCGKSADVLSEGQLLLRIFNVNMVLFKI